MRSVVLLSAGLDSSLNMLEAMQNSRLLLALTFNYGQRASKKEIQFAAQLCQSHSVKHQIVELDWMRDFSGSALMDRKLKIPTHEVRIDDLVTSQQTAKSVWVPNRNGILLNIAAGFAESIGAEWIIPGFNSEEAATFADNSNAYLESLNDAFGYSTANHVKIKCFTTQMNKSEIIKRGLELKMDFDLVWPCYFDGDLPCGECESCQRFVRAARANQVETKWMKKLK